MKNTRLWLIEKMRANINILNIIINILIYTSDEFGLQKNQGMLRRVPLVRTDV
jgi:hypothetical protein